MARPKTQRSTDLKRVRHYFEDAQAKRFNALKIFIDQIRTQELLNEVRHDDRLFAAVLELAAEEYGLRFNEISEKIEVSAATVGRWSKQINLPHSAFRPLVVEAIADLLENYVKTSAKNRDILPGRVYAN